MKIRKAERAILVVFVLWLTACGKHEAPVSTTAEVTPAPVAAVPNPTAAVPNSTDIAGIVEAGNCALDAVDGAPLGGPPLKSGAKASFAGWMGNADGQVPAEAALVLDDGNGHSYAITVVGGGHRPDVAAALGKPGLELSGYNLESELRDVAPGDYSLYILHGGAAPLKCTLNARITVAAAE